MNKYDKAIMILTYYATTYKWVYEICEEENLLKEITVMSENPSKEEIKDYIKIVKEKKNNNRIDMLRLKLKLESEPIKQAEILDEILKLKRENNKQNNIY